MDSTVLAAIVTGVFGILTIIITKIIEKTNNKIDLKIIQHPYFTKSEMMKNHIEKYFTLENKGKEIVFKDILYNELNFYREELIEFANKIDDNKINNETELLNECISVLNNVITKHHTYYINNNNYTLEEQKVLEKVMKKFDTWNESKVELIESQLTTVCTSPFYNSIKTKAAVILDLFTAFTIDTINDASKTLNKINGDLKGLKFKNIII